MDELRAIVMRAGDTWTATGLSRVAMVKAEACSDQMYEPMLHLVLQGTKSLSIGDQILHFEPATYFAVPVDLPALGQICSARPGIPYLALSLTFDPAVIAAMLTDLGDTAPAQTAPSFSVCAAPPELIDAWLRLMRLIDRPAAEVAMLAPMIEREILYRLLQGPQGAVLRQIARSDSRLGQVRRAVAWIREHYDQPLRIETLAELAGMSAASFHRHFKTATAMSPLQYQKCLRLQQARRLLIANQDATRAGYAVGYESASQFSREYSRLFGLPPARDAVRLRSDGGSLNDVASA